MKKIYILLMALLPMIMVAQPTISHYESYTIGTVANYEICKNTSFSPQSGGANQTWIFTTLQDSLAGTLRAVSPNTTAYVANFSWSNLCLRSSDGHYVYLDTLGGGISYQVGAVDTSSLGMAITRYTPDSLEYAQGSMSMNQNFHDSCTRWFPTFPNPPYHGSGVDTTIADGWGSLALPHGLNYASVLRVKSVRHFTDTLVALHTTSNAYSISYAWYSPNYPYPVLRMDSVVMPAGAGTYKSFRYSSLGMGVNEIENAISGFQVYPNPFANTATVAFNTIKAEQVTMDVYDLVGTKVYSKDQGLMTAGNHEMKFDGSNLAAGMYFITLRVGEKNVTQKVTLTK